MFRRMLIAFKAAYDLLGVVPPIRSAINQVRTRGVGERHAVGGAAALIVQGLWLLESTGERGDLTPVSA